MQAMVEDHLENDDRRRLWSTGSQVDRIESGSVSFIAEADGRRLDFEEHIFPPLPEPLTEYRLHGEFRTSGPLTKGK